MPRKKKSKPVDLVEEAKLELPPLNELPAFEKVAEVSEVEPVVEESSDTVKVKVKVGSLHWEGGWFKKGDVFECSRVRAEQFEFNDVEILG